MATAATWSKLRYFKKNSSYDKWGDPDAIFDKHLFRLDDFRHWIGTAIYINHGVKTSGHSQKSYHYVQNGACATDVVIPGYGADMFQLILDATRFGFTGIGYYPHWQFKGRRVGGLHLDSRPLKLGSDKTIEYSHSRWMGVMIEGVQQYVALTTENLKTYANFEQGKVLP